ncbi:SAM-dependent methyltransferase [Nonomuraea guangzhouensis]|uniref:SAM-dependent methyltransferase n=1 Tax=Nonomuraea guangzhouensis TaxID=1291555 RepID=A0ABW4G736_9ACTN|nr:SAM-dependent methyltransferase [Nonomuraea guangzhouensis]
MRQRAIRNLTNLDTTRASVTRILDAAAGGKNHFEVDSDAVRRYDEAVPVTGSAARAVLRYLTRVVSHLAGAGIDQFLIIGSGVPSALPPGHQLHDVARDASAASDVRVVYVENDPMVLANAHVTIERVHDLVRVVEGDVRQIEEMLTDEVVARFLDWERPVGVLLLSTHSLSDDELASFVIKRLRHAVVDGSYLALLQTTFDGIPTELLPAINDLLAMTLPGHVIRSRAEVAALMDGLELLDPGLVWVPLWRPDGLDCACADQPSSSGNYGAVARLP